MFTTVDYLLLFLYFAVLTLIGFRFYRKNAGSSDFFVGGRMMTWLPVAISIIASDTSAITLLGTPGYTYAPKQDFRLVFNTFAYCAAAWLVIWIFLPFYCRLRMVTAYEYLEKRFDVKVRSLTSFLFLLIRGSHVAIAMYAPALLVAAVTGFRVSECILVIGAFTTLYTTLGGIRAVVWTDVVQFTVVVLGISFVFGAGITQIDGGFAEAMQIGKKAGKFNVWDFSLDLTSEYTFWAMFFGCMIGALATMGTDQAVLQRFFTAKSEAECRRSLQAYSIITIPFQLVLLLLGIVLFAYYKQHPADLAQLQGVKADDILGKFAIRQLPRIVTVLLVGAILAASMGVMSAGINSLSTCTVIDFHKRFWFRTATDESCVRAGRWYTVMWGVMTTVGALFAGGLGQLATSFSKVQNYIGGVMLGIFLLGIFLRRSTARGALIGGVAGMIVVSYVAFWTDITFFWYGLIGGGTTLLVGYLVSLTNPPGESVPEELVIHFGKQK